MNIEAIQEALRQLEIDAWLFFDHHQRDPLAYRILGFQPERHVTRRWYYLIPATGQPGGLVHRVEPTMLDALPGAKHVYGGWNEQQTRLSTLLAGHQRIAMQYSPRCAIPYVSNVDAGTVEMIRGFGVEVVSSADLVQLFEASWSEEQLEAHWEAGRRVDQVRRDAFALVGERLRSGAAVTELAVADFIRDAFAARGLFTDHGPIVAVNANISNPHYEPTRAHHAPIRSGDVLLIDLWAKLNESRAVYYDITWTGYCGTQVPDEVRNVFHIVTGARDAAVDCVKTAIAAGADIRGYQVDDAARDFISGHGYGPYFVHRTGHSIGEDVHGAGANMDNLESHDERRLIPATCFSIEPGIYLPHFGIRSEVNVYIAEREAFVTGEVQSELVMVV